MLKRICLLLLALLTLGACQQEEEKEQGSVAVANPFTTCETLTEAEKVAQFSLSIPEELRDCEGILFRAANSPSLQLLEVVFPLEQGGEKFAFAKRPARRISAACTRTFRQKRNTAARSSASPCWAMGKRTFWPCGRRTATAIPSTPKRAWRQLFCSSGSMRPSSFVLY